MAKAEGF